MTCHTRLLILVAVMAAGLCLTPTDSNKAVAQITFSVRGISPSYYNGYSSGYTHGHVNAYGRHGYTTYGNGPYGYGSAVPYGYPSTLGYGYRSGTSYNFYSRGVQIQGGTRQPVYRPNTTRYYSPYGYGYRGY